MFVRNLLQAGERISLLPGEYVTLVPVGIPLTLQYSDKGLLQKVYLNHEEENWVDKTEDYFQILFKRNSVPNKISFTGNTSYVRGVLVTSNIYAATSKEPNSILSELCTKYLADPASFTFYAGDVQSYSAAFKGAVAVRQWLTVSKFNVLPGYVIPQDLTEAQFEHMVKMNYPFVFPLIDSYILYHNDGSITYPKTQLRQVTVKSVDKQRDTAGNIEAVIRDTLGDIRVIPYSTLVHYNIQPNSIIVVDSDDNIVHCLAATGELSTLSNRLRCDCCGRQITVPVTGNTRCADPQCNSVLYPRVKQLCHYLNLPEMSYEDYTEYTDTVGNAFIVLDIFDHPDYKDTELEITMAQGLRAIVPKSVLPGQAQITQLCDTFSNSVQTMTYYLQHPDKIATDFNLDSHAYQRFLQWIDNVENCTDVVELFKLPNLHIVQAEIKFEGEPIFRNKTIYVTGSFIHGSLIEIRNIFQSYAATVTFEYNDTVDCVVIGDGQENVNGHAVLSARKHQIPIMSESQFFLQYDIDADLAENL